MIDRSWDVLWVEHSYRLDRNTCRSTRSTSVAGVFVLKVK